MFSDKQKVLYKDDEVSITGTIFRTRHKLYPYVIINDNKTDIIEKMEIFKDNVKNIKKLYSGFLEVE